jgi:cytochrome c oxidase cbb3-type subunit 3
MADLPSDFWSGWIILLTVISFIGLVWLVVSVYIASPDPREVEDTTWDENLKEGTNPAPFWWFWLIFAMMIFSVFYLMLYPGLGSFKGAFQWSMGGRIEERVDDFEDEFSEIRAVIAGMPLEDIRSDIALMASASDLFEQNCSACHGYEAQGQADLFPNLSDDIWQWGGTAENIELSIRSGRNAIMTSWEALLGQEGVINVADYVLLIGRQEAEGHAGQAQFNQLCAACHTPNGTGNPLLGAPDLTDADWLYGGDIETIRETIREGRNGIMPAFDEKLDDTQIRLLVAWLTNR